MKRLLLAALLLPASCAVFAAQPVASPRRASLEDLLGNPRFIGQVVEVEACAGIPMDDAPSQSNLILIYPCNVNLAEADNPSAKAAMGQLSKATVFRPAKGWNMGDSPLFRGRFRGVLRKGVLPGEDMKDVRVIDLEEVDFLSSVPVSSK